MSNILKSLSYFEFQCKDGDFVSRWPSEKTIAGKLIEEQTDTSKSDKQWVFDAPMPRKCEVYEHLNALKTNKLLFTDFYWFLKPATNYTSTEIIHWFGSLYFTDPHVTKHHIKYTIKSVMDKSFEVPVHKTRDSLPQEAIDSIPICKTDNGDFRVLLGRRAANPPIVIYFPASTITIGNDDGYILYGEHLLPEKKKQIEQIYVSFLAGDNPYLEISEQDASEALRAVYEEGGLQFNGKVRAYMLEKDSTPARDLRYWTYTSACPQFGIDSITYGYQRKSSSFNVLLVVPTIDSLPEPVDVLECQKGVILSKDLVEKEFQVGGKYNPVFPSHVRQLKNAMDVANLLS